MRLLESVLAVSIKAILFAADPGTDETVRLPIPPRLQWTELHGYCGECSIQQAALYFGTYASQRVCRGIINPNQHRQVLVGANERKVLTALRLHSEEFDHNDVAAPQFEAYFCWVKQHLQSGHPVMIVAYDPQGHDADYDHIMLATGFTSRNAATYHPFDRLFFNNNFSRTTIDRRAATLPDTRQMLGNGEHYEFCVPEIIDYGCAITGIVDDSQAALPVQIHLGTWSEPDLIAGKHPVLLDAKLTVGGLTSGRLYTLYRYNDYLDVPADDYAESEYSCAESFVAIGSTAAFSASILSDGVAVFRCLPAGE